MPVAFVLSLLFSLAGLAGLGLALVARRHRGTAALGTFGLWALALLLLVVASFDKVEEYEVGIPISFGNAGDPVGPGINWHAPWVTMTRQDTRVQELTFNGENRIESQAQGGGSLNLDLRVQWRIPVAGAVDVYRNVGTDKDRIQQVVIIPAVRECPRNITTSYTPEGAFTTDREAIRDRTLDCVRAEVAPFGIEIPDLFLGEVDPGQRVKDEIDTKVAVQQQINRAAEELRLQELELQKQEVSSRQAAVQAYGVSQAEQIVSCGGIPVIDDEGNVIDVRPDEQCTDQFSDEYLTWLFIQSLDEVGDLSIVTESLDASLLLPASGSDSGS